LFPANQPHLFKGNLEIKEMATLSLFFKKDNPLWSFPELKAVAGFLESMEGAFRVKDGAKEAVQESLQAIAGRPVALRLSLFIELMQRLVLRGELELIGESALPLVSDKEGLRVNTVLQFAMNHYDRTITLEEAAARVHMVPGSFCRFFKKRTGKTFVRFLNEIRVREACQRLASQKDQRISEVAYSCGFKNVSSFNRVFRQIMGQSPTEYLAGRAEFAP
jgi:AraC-like DNA-binding protein